MRDDIGGNLYMAIVNAKSKCHNNDVEDIHSYMMNGVWDRDLDCPQDRKIVGVEIIRSGPYSKLINFRAQCALQYMHN